MHQIPMKPWSLRDNQGTDADFNEPQRFSWQTIGGLCWILLAYAESTIRVDGFLEFADCAG